MNPFVRTTHTTHPLLISKMVVVLLLIFFPVLASANPVYQSSSNYSSTPSTVGASSMQYMPESYQMTSTSNYQTGTTLNPASTVYAPFSDENPSSNSLGSLGGATASNGKDGFLNPGDPNKDKDHTEYPIGDAWSLLIFAAMAAGVIYIKQRKKIEAKG